MIPQIGRTGAWLGALTVVPAAVARPTAAAVEELGYGCLWYPEGLGTRESFTNGAVLLGATERLVVASGIANIWGRDPVACANATRVLDDAFEGRFLLGLGVSHPTQVDPRGHAYRRPVAHMRDYLAAMDDDPFVSPDGGGAQRPPVQRVLAALRPPMLELAAEASAGAHTFLVTPEHTRLARAALGPDRLLAVEQKVVLAADAATGRARARAAIGWYLATENYRANLRWLGFDDAAMADGGSDELVDALVAWGDEEAIVARLDAHRAAGADHVAIQPLGADDDPLGLDVLRRLAPHVTGA